MAPILRLERRLSKPFATSCGGHFSAWLNSSSRLVHTHPREGCYLAHETTGLVGAGRAVPASVSRRVTIAFLVSAFLAVIAGALGISFAVRSSDASRTALKTLLPAATTANQLLADVVDQETGERGFVLPTTVCSSSPTTSVR